MTTTARRNAVERQPLARDRALWIWLVILALVAALHAGGGNPLRNLLAQVSLQLTPCLIERLLFLVPVAFAAWTFGSVAGALTIGISLTFMLVHAISESCTPQSILQEMTAILILAAFLNWILDRLHREQEARTRERQVGLERLSVSEKRFRGLFENASDAIWLQDGCGRLLAVNRACTHLTGHSVSELIGQPVEKLLTEPLVEGGQERTLKRRNGSQAFVEIVVSPMPGNGDHGGWLCIARDVTERHLREESTRFFARQWLEAQEKERQRIARELHDSTVQSLVVVSNRLETFLLDGHKLSPPDQEHLGRTQQIVLDAMVEARRFSQNLRPPALDDLGLVPCLEELAAELQRVQGITVQVSVTGEHRRLNAPVELTLYRIAQEALNNVRRHACASNVILDLRFFPDTVQVAVHDDGRGCKLPEHLADLATSGRLGLAGIHERAQLLGGETEISSAVGEGTTVRVELPA